MAEAREVLVEWVEFIGYGGQRKWSYDNQEYVPGEYDWNTRHDDYWCLIEADTTKKGVQILTFGTNDDLGGHWPSDADGSLTVRRNIFVLALRRILDGAEKQTMASRGSFSRVDDDFVIYETECGQLHRFSRGEMQEVLNWIESA